MVQVTAVRTERNDQEGAWTEDQILMQQSEPLQQNKIQFALFFCGLGPYTICCCQFSLNVLVTLTTNVADTDLAPEEFSWGALLIFGGGLQSSHVFFGYFKNTFILLPES